MNSLFIRLYLDEDIDGLLAMLLRARHYDVLTTQGAGRKHTYDPHQLAYATSLQRAILTHNRVDFENLARTYTEAGRTHHGIIIAKRRDVYELARRVLGLLDRVTADEMENQVRYL